MNPVFLSIGPITIYWYSVLILTAFILGYFFVSREMKKEGMSVSFLVDYFFYLVPIVIIGARAYYVIFEWQSYQNNIAEIFAVWNGGLAIHGGIIAGLIFTIFYTKKKQINTLKLFDIIAPCLILGQAIGRWGNFFNQEAHGPETTLSFLQNLHLPEFIIEGMHFSDLGKYAYWHPTFLYESLGCLIGFGLILFVQSRKKVHIGTSTAIYFIVYGITRFFIEALRQDSLMFLGLKIAQLVSIVMVLAGVILMIYSIKCEKFYHRKENENE